MGPPREREREVGQKQRDVQCKGRGPGQRGCPGVKKTRMDAQDKSGWGENAEALCANLVQGVR